MPIGGSPLVKRYVDESGNEQTELIIGANGIDNLTGKPYGITSKTPYNSESMSGIPLETKPRLEEKCI